jgi:VanZ family protein
MGRGTRAEAARPAPLVAGLRAAGGGLQRIPRRLAWIPVALWMGLITALSSVPGRPGGTSATWAYLSNLGHAPLFGLLALWAALLLPREAVPSRPGRWPRLDARGHAAVLAGVLAFGVIDELHQLSTGRRDFSVLDLATDLTGAACVLWVAAAVGHPRSTGAGVAGRLMVSAGLCLAAAAVATWLPGFFEGVAWM